MDPELAMVMVGTCGPLNGTASTSSGSRTLRYVLFFSFSSPPLLSLAESCVRVPAVKDANRMKTLLAWTLLLKPSMACLSVCVRSSAHLGVSSETLLQVRLKHRDTSAYLYTHNVKYGSPIAGQQVSGYMTERCLCVCDSHICGWAPRAERMYGTRSGFSPCSQLESKPPSLIKLPESMLFPGVAFP